MRLIGFIGILGLLVFGGLGLFVSIKTQDWKGSLLMLFLFGLLAFCTAMLWRGRQLEREPQNGGRLADGWAGESVIAFLRHQVLRSPEGLIFLAGSAISLVFAGVALFAPSTIGMDAERAAANAALFGVWPVLAFVLYVNICGPDFSSDWHSIVAMVAVVVMPFIIAFK